MAIELKPNAIPGASDGNKLVLQECVATSWNGTISFSTPSAGTTTLDLGAIANSSVTQEASKTEKKSEDGQVQKVSSTYTYKTTADLMQEDKDLLDFIAHTVKGKRYLEMIYRGYINAKYQWIFKFGEVTAQLNSVRPGDGVNNKYEFTGLKINAAQTLTSTFLATISALLTLTGFPTVAVTIPLADQQAIVEV